MSKDNMYIGRIKLPEIYSECYKLRADNERLESKLTAYKIALGYFAKEGGQPAVDIIRNLLKEVEG
jgi:hypothetical protein